MGARQVGDSDTGPTSIRCSSWPQSLESDLSPALCFEFGGPLVMSSRTSQYPERSVGDVLLEIKDELKHFVETRFELLRSELQEGIATVKSAAPLAAAAAVFLVTAYFLLTLALVSAIAIAFWNNPYHWFFAFLIVGVVWMVTAAILAFLVRNNLRTHGLVPKKTIEVLKRDKRWLQNEAKGSATV
jgi:uncharacterized membrane protein YqjE